MNVADRGTVTSRWIGILVLAAGLTAGPVAAQDEMSSRERLALSPGAANRVARHDLMSVLEPVAGFPRGNRLRLNEVVFATRPYGTGYAGLCRREWLTLRYAPPVADDHPEDTPIAPYGLDTTVVFHVSRPKPTPLKPGDHSSAPFQGDCTHLSSSANDGWFTADDEDTAVEGHFALVAALARVKAGTLTPKTCPPVYDETRRCIDPILAAADTAHYGSITRCPADHGQGCYRIESALTIVTVTLKRVVDVPGAADVEAVEVEQDIIIT